MLALLLLILLLPSGLQNLAAAFPPPSGSTVLQLFQTTTFHNTVYVATEGMGLLDDIPLGVLDSHTWNIHFLKPWVHPALPRSDWDTISDMIKIYLSEFHHVLQESAVLKEVPYPFVVQCNSGCELFPNNTGKAFVYVGYNGDDFLTYDMDTRTWLPLQHTELVTYVMERLENYTAFTELVQVLFNHTCIDDMKMFLRAAKEDLERQVQPVAVVFAHQTPDPSRLLLVCHVTGFYPGAVRVSWLRDGHEVPLDPALGSTPLLPNADLTYQLRRIVAVVPGDGHSYVCHVQHSSLGGHDLLLPWDPDGANTSHVTGIVIAIVILLMVAVAIAGVLWRRRKNYEDADAIRRLGLLM